MPGTWLAAGSLPRRRSWHGWRANRGVRRGGPPRFDGDGALFRLVSEAYRIRLAYLFDPMLAVHTSLIDPFPHQITAVYEAIRTRPGAVGKEVRSAVR